MKYSDQPTETFYKTYNDEWELTIKDYGWYNVFHMCKRVVTAKVYSGSISTDYGRLPEAGRERIVFRNNVNYNTMICDNCKKKIPINIEHAIRKKISEYA